MLATRGGNGNGIGSALLCSRRAAAAHSFSGAVHSTLYNNTLNAEHTSYFFVRLFTSHIYTTVHVV